MPGRMYVPAAASRRMKMTYIAVKLITNQSRLVGNCDAISMNFLRYGAFANAGQSGSISP
jgi:hypothetical protein